MYTILKFYFVDFTFFQFCQIRQAGNTCALQSWEKYYFSKQNITINTAFVIFLKHILKADIMIKSLARLWQWMWMDLPVPLDWEGNVQSEVLLDTYSLLPIPQKFDEF